MKDNGKILLFILALAALSYLFWRLTMSGASGSGIPSTPNILDKRGPIWDAKDKLWCWDGGGPFLECPTGSAAGGWIAAERPA